MQLLYLNLDNSVNQPYKEDIQSPFPSQGIASKRFIAACAHRFCCLSKSVNVNSKFEYMSHNCKTEPN